MRGCIIFVISLIYSLNLLGADYYWIGGSGDWSDITHWATSSGGSTQHILVPGVNDIVYFDDNSFNSPNQIVTVSDHIFCKELHWEKVNNNPAFVGPNSFNINIYGSIYLSGSMSWQIKGSIYLKSSSPETHISLQGILLSSDVIVDISPGTWAILDNSFQSQSGLIFLAGNFDANQQDINAQSLQFNYQSGMHQVNLQGGIMRLSGTIANLSFASDFIDLDASGTSITIDAGQSFIRNTGSQLINLETVRSVHSNGETVIMNSPSWPDSPLFNIRLFEFGNAGIINGSNRFDTCKLTAGYTYELASGNTQYVDYLTATGLCSAPILINSSTEGAHASINSSEDQICDFLRIKDIHIVGSGKFQAKNSRDLGNNSGWQITGPTNLDLYWVGGSGDWGDPNHWSLTTGGPGGACVPTASDNVYFDTNSFTSPGQSVAVNLAYVECNHMTWSNIPANTSITGDSDKSFHFQGSLILTDNLNFSFAGDLYFEGNNGSQQVQTKGIVIPGDINFEGVNTTWTLQDELKSNSWIKLNQGNLITQNYGIECLQFESTTTLNRSFDLGTSRLSSNAIDIQYMGLNMVSAGATIELVGISSRFTNIGNFGTVVFDRFIGSADESAISKFGSINIVINELIFNAKGVISGDITINNLTLASGYKYTFSNNTPSTGIKIKNIQATGRCDGYIILESANKGIPVVIESSANQSLSNAIVSDVHIDGGATYIASNSVDLGNNANWSFTNSLKSRELYWVGGSGQWEDPVHWSLTSGGPGGECIPTPMDNVHFDKLSFNGAGQSVTTNQNLIGQCHNFTWEGPPQDASIDLFELEVYASLNLSTLFNNQINRFLMKGDQPGLEIETTSQTLNNLNFAGQGEWTLMSPLNFSGIEMTNGKLITMNQPLDGGHIWLKNSAGISLGNSYIKLSESGFVGTGTFDIGSEQVQFEGGNSIIEFTHENGQLHAVGPNQLHNVYFSNFRGTSSLHTDNIKVGMNPPVVTFNSVVFNNSGKIIGNNVFDSLVFSPGKTYTLESDAVQRINSHWKVRGTNCKPILLFSSLTGKQAIVEKSSGTVNGDFVILHNQKAIGGATFLAGQNSTDLGNNQGWDFQQKTPHNGAGILGKDQILCGGETLTLNQGNFIEASSYFWNGNPGSEEFTINSPGTYYLQAIFPGNCTLNDTINILPSQDFDLALGSDTMICQGQSIELNGDVGVQQATYSWSTGETTSRILVDSIGVFHLQVTVNGCSQSDTIKISQAQFAGFSLRDTSTCLGDTLSITAPISADNYLWSTGDNSSRIKIFSNGMYWLRVDMSGCTFIDTFTVDFEVMEMPDLGPDTSLCQGSTMDLKVKNFDPTSNYLWSTGSSGSQIVIDQQGTYSVISNADGCLGFDTIEVVENVPLPLLLPESDTICSGDSLLLSITQNGSVLWNDGSTESEILIVNGGDYHVTLNRAGCLSYDTIQIIEISISKPDLGGDTSLCQGEKLLLQLPVEQNVNYFWSTGVSGPSLTIDKPGTFTVSKEHFGCTSSNTIEVFYLDQIELNLKDRDTLCPMEILHIDLGLSHGNIQWSNGAIGSKIDIDAPGKYLVQVQQAKCKLVDSILIVESTLPLPNLGPDTAICGTDSLVLNISSPIFPETIWNDESTGGNLVVNTSGLYWVKVSDGKCTLSDSIQVAAIQMAEMNLQDTLICNGDSLKIDLGITGYDISWNHGLKDSKLTLVDPGQYRVTITSTGCEIIDSFYLSQHPPIAVDLGNSLLLCAGDSLELNASTGEFGINYLWSDGTQGPIMRSIALESDYYYVYVSDGICNAMDSVLVSVIPIPELDLGADRQLCAGDSVILEIDESFQSVMWQNGKSDSQITIHQPGKYYVDVFHEGCLASDTVMIDYLDISSLDLIGDSVGCNSFPISLTVDIPGFSVEWSTGSIQSTETFTQEGSYFVILDNGLCSIVDSFRLSFKNCDAFQIFIPNIFSPNGDGVNDQFSIHLDPEIEVLNFGMYIYDRWGSLVFAQNQMSGWDGLKNGSSMATGSYIYKVEVEYLLDGVREKWKQSGDVMLIR